MGQSVGQFNLWNGSILWKKFCEKSFGTPEDKICHGIIFNISPEFYSLLCDFPDKRELKSVLQYLIGTGDFNENWAESVAFTAIKIFYAVMNSDKINDIEMRQRLRWISIFLKLSEISERKEEFRKVGDFLKRKMGKTIRTIDRLLEIENRPEEELADEAAPMAVDGDTSKPKTVRWGLSPAVEMKTHGLFHEASKEPSHQPR